MSDNIRTFGVQTLTGTAQPWFGDALTAAVIAQPQNVSNYQAKTIISVASTTKYRVGDYLIVDPGTANREGCGIAGIPSATTLMVSGLTKAHASAALVALNIKCFNVVIQNIGGTALYLGSDQTVTNVPGGSAFSYISIGGYWNYGYFNYNGLRSADGWIVGTAASTYLAYALTE